MQTKLTLRLDEDLIKRAKAYSKRTGKSVSRIVADFFALLNPTAGKPPPELPPRTQSLLGALSEAALDEDDYRAHLLERHR